MAAGAATDPDADSGARGGRCAGRCSICDGCHLAGVTCWPVRRGHKRSHGVAYVASARDDSVKPLDDARSDGGMEMMGPARKDAPSIPSTTRTSTTT